MTKKLNNYVWKSINLIYFNQLNIFGVMHTRINAPIKFIFEGFSLTSESLFKDEQKFNDFESQVVNFAKDWLSKREYYTFQTSGSTGLPKSNTFSRKQIKASVELTQQTFGLHIGQTSLLCLSPEFIAGKMMIIRALEIGMDLYCIAPCFNPLESLPFGQSIGFAAMVPSQIEAILNSSSANKLSQIKTMLVGGASVKDEMVNRLQLSPTKFYGTYGMTETLTHIAIRSLNPVQPYFCPLAGIQISIDDRNCLVIQANHLGIKVATNDMAKLNPDNSFEVLGRIDNVINSGGVKIFPETIEAKIVESMKIEFPGKEYFIGGLPDERFGENVVLIIQSEESIGKTGKLADNLKLILKKYEVPRKILFIPSFFKTSAGKIKRKETLALVGG